MGELALEHRQRIARLSSDTTHVYRACDLVVLVSRKFLLTLVEVDDGRFRQLLDEFQHDAVAVVTNPAIRYIRGYEGSGDRKGSHIEVTFDNVRRLVKLQFLRPITAKNL